MPTREQVTEALRGVIDPELRRSIVDLGMVRSTEIAEGGAVSVVVSLTTPGCPIRSHFQQAVSERVGALEGVSRVAVSSPPPNRSQSRRFSDSCCAARRSTHFAPTVSPAR